MFNEGNGTYIFKDGAIQQKHPRVEVMVSSSADLAGLSSLAPGSRAYIAGGAQVWEMGLDGAWHLLGEAPEGSEEAADRLRVTSLDSTLLGNGTVIEAIGIPQYVDDVTDYAEYSMTDPGWYLFVRVAGKTGEYIPVCFYGVTDGEILSKNIETLVSKRKNWDVEFGGSFFSNKLMMTQLVVILIISLALMYFILCAQFESFLQPLIVLLEIPIDIAAALLVLWITGISLNLMSGIGIIVSCGIIINDSILKIDTINELRKQGMTIKDAVHTAGLRRLRAIIMTSLTTIGAMLPILFTSDMGSELRQPLAVVMIASMTIGTLVSLFVIQVAYTKIVGPPPPASVF